jgi:two-component system CheB/CheR fusion protein
MKKGKNKRLPAAKISTEKSNKENREPLLAVGIGASAGGLEAFSQLLKIIPDDTGMAFIFIQHLEPKHESKLSEILSGVSSIPVKQVKHNMEVKPDNVYVIPPDKYLVINPW